MASRLNAGDQLGVGQQITSDNGKFKLVMQGDGNLVEYQIDNNDALWATNTLGTGSTHAVMQGDGNFVVYDANGKPHWDTKTWHNVGAYLVLEDDANTIVFNAGGVPIWASGITSNPNNKYIKNQHAKWENDYYSIASVQYNPDALLATVDVELTNTFKFAGFIAGTRLIFWGADQKIISTADNTLYCPQAPIIGAAHQSTRWNATAPAGTAGFGLLQYYKPVGLAAFGDAIVQVVDDVGTILGGAATDITTWCQQNQDDCQKIVLGVFIIAGLALCLSFPADCEVVITVGSAALVVAPAAKPRRAAAKHVPATV